MGKPKRTSTPVSLVPYAFGQLTMGSVKISKRNNIQYTIRIFRDKFAAIFASERGMETGDLIEGTHYVVVRANIDDKILELLATTEFLPWVRNSPSNDDSPSTGTGWVKATSPNDKSMCGEDQRVVTWELKGTEYPRSSIKNLPSTTLLGEIFPLKQSKDRNLF